MKRLFGALIEPDFSVCGAVQGVEFLGCQPETGGGDGVEVVEDRKMEFGWESCETRWRMVC